MIRIGIDIRELEKDKVTGISRILLGFIKYAAEKRKNWEFFLYGNQKTNIEMVLPNLHKTFIPEKYTLVWDQLILPRQLKKDKVDLFFSPYPKAPILLSAKLIITICDLIPLRFPVYRNIKNKFYFEIFVRRLAQKAGKVITISKNSKSDIVDMLNIPEDKIEVIYPAIDKNYYKLSAGQSFKVLRERYNINKNFIFYLGNPKPHKNIRGLIEAYDMLSRDLKETYDLIIGGVSPLNISKGRDPGLPLGNGGIKFIGFIPESDLVNFYSSASLFVFPSFYEGFGLPVLEAMACGCPVVCSKTSSLPEVVGNAGVLVDPYSPEDISRGIGSALKDESLMRELQLKGQNQAGRFNVSEMSRRILDCIDNMCEASPRTCPPPRTCKKILIIFMGGIGNTVLFTPALSALRKRYADAHISVLISSYSVSEMLSPWVNEIISVDSFNIFKLLVHLRRKRFNMSIIGTGMNPIKSGLLSFLAGVKYRVGEDIKGRGLFYNIKVRYDKNLHELDANLRIMDAIGVKSEIKEPILWVSEEDEQFAENFIRESGIRDSDLVVGIHPGSGSNMAYKRWPKERFAEISDRLIKEYNAKIILFGGPDEKGLVGEIVRLMKTSPIIAAGKTTLMQAAALLERCRFLICNDSGLMHVSAAVKTPVIAIFGPTIPNKISPYGSSHTVIRKELPCSPCYRYRPVRCKTFKCLNLISVDSVINVVFTKIRKSLPR